MVFSLLTWNRFQTLFKCQLGYHEFQKKKKKKKKMQLTSLACSCPTNPPPILCAVPSSFSPSPFTWLWDAIRWVLVVLFTSSIFMIVFSVLSYLKFTKAISKKYRIALKEDDLIETLIQTGIPHNLTFGSSDLLVLAIKRLGGGVFLLVKLQAEACNFSKSNTPPCMHSKENLIGDKYDVWFDWVH